MGEDSEDFLFPSEMGMDILWASAPPILVLWRREGYAKHLLIKAMLTVGVPLRIVLFG